MPTARVVIVSGTIKTTDGDSYGLKVASNKTIMGANQSATIYGGLALSGVSNVIIRNLNIQGVYPNTGPGDTLASSNSHHVWYDHLAVWDADDGLLNRNLAPPTLTTPCREAVKLDASSKSRVKRRNLGFPIRIGSGPRGRRRVAKARPSTGYLINRRPLVIHTSRSRDALTHIPSYSRTSFRPSKLAFPDPVTFTFATRAQLPFSPRMRTLVPANLLLEGPITKTVAKFARMGLALESENVTLTKIPSRVSSSRKKRTLRHETLESVL